MRTLILGAGPAGLAAADALCAAGHPAVVLERAAVVGGLSRTVERDGYRFDVGGHRFFTRYARVEALWHELLGTELRERPRLSRILYRGRLYPYPLQILPTLRNLGVVETARCTTSYLRARARRREALTFQDWVSQRFGRRLFDLFFRTYTEKVWGIGCDQISADWAAQRIKNLSLGKAMRNAVLGGRDVTSLIDRFWYPRLGPGQMWEALAHRVEQRGGEVRRGTTVVGIRRDGKRVVGVTVQSEAGQHELDADHVISSIPLTILVQSMVPPAPHEVLAAASSLRFRHLIAVCLVVEGTELFPDNWVYVHDPELRVARIQNQGNWSPELVPEPGRSGLSLEYFASDGDALWTASDDDLIALAQRELAQTGLCDPEVVRGFVIRAPRAYPVYGTGYEAPLRTVSSWVQQLDGLDAIGRYGMFKYNNSDHSVLTAMLTVDNLLGRSSHDVWSVNSDEQYHEER